MKAIILSTLTIGAFFIAGCGGSSPIIHIGSPVGPFVLTVNPASSSVASFKGDRNSGTISPDSSAKIGSAPSAVLIQSPSTPQLNVFVTDSVANKLSLLNLDTQTGVLTDTGFSVPVGVNPVALGVLNGATVATLVQPQFGFIYVLNQGSNNLSVFKITDMAGHLSAVPGSPFTTPANPQSIAVANNNTIFIYVAAGNQQVAGYQANADGSLTALPALGVPATANISAVFFKFPFLYAADTANSQILGFKVQSDGSLVSVGPGVSTGTQPGSMTTAFGSMIYVANSGSNNISGYRQDAVTGILTPLSGFPVGAGTTPVYLSTVDALHHLYAANQGSSNLSAFTVDFNSGALVPVPGSPFAMATPPRGVETVFIMNVD